MPTGIPNTTKLDDELAGALETALDLPAEDDMPEAIAAAEADQDAERHQISGAVTKLRGHHEALQDHRFALLDSITARRAKLAAWRAHIDDLDREAAGHEMEVRSALRSGVMAQALLDADDLILGGRKK